jgi:small conductance mechanosensitive channel
VNRFLTVGPDLEQRLPGLQKRANLYTPLLTNSGRLLVYALAGLLVLQAWGLNALAWVATNAGQRVIGGMVTISLTAAVALAVWEGVSMAIEVYLARPGADGTPVERSARTRTLLPLFRKTLAIVLGLAVGLMALATLGVNIGPLLAGAGIAGIAVGFGAQSLVKDVITGMFVLMQDAVAVGDVVAVAGNSGLVEQISIRSIRLRDLHGTVIIIPFSEVTTVQNMTKDFSYAVFDIGIAYREDVDHVIGVVQALAADLRADEEYAWRILEPIEILGLDQFADSAVIVKARIKTKPIQQWNVMREFNRRLKRRFDELDIEMPFPHQTIYFGADRQGPASPSANGAGHGVVVRLKLPRNANGDERFLPSR